ncbi:MAG TPA: L-rhamnose mutarotase [Flavitalea sp.]|nr:L-rhamnose mutarotase [Flavitalea sp.]
MKRLAFRMKLFAGQEKEYKKRHEEIWPELVSLLKKHGVNDYSIFLDPQTLDLFGVLVTNDPIEFELLSQSPVMQRWWQYMKDIMETNPDGSPVSIQLNEVFYMK